MTLQEYKDIKYEISKEYNYMIHRKADTEFYCPSKWTAEDEAEYQKWCERYNRITNWETNVLEQAIRGFNRKIFEEFVMK